MKLWPHQSKVLTDLAGGNFMLAWEPGCGKTLPALVQARQYNQPTLYVATAPTREQVGEEATRVGFPKVQVIRTGKDKLDPEASVVVVADSQVGDLARWKGLMAREWGVVVLDEAHRYKNQSATRTRAIYGTRIGSPGALFRRGQRVWPLTGTPVLNDPSELWTHVSRLWPEVLVTAGTANSKQWMGRYCHVRETPYGPHILGGKNLGELSNLLKPYLSRLTLSEAQPDMPPLTVDTLHLSPERVDVSGVPPEALAELDALLGLAEDSEDEDFDFSRFEPPLATLRQRIGLIKALDVANLAKEELHGGAEKLAIFYIHTAVGQLLEDALARYHPIKIDGRTRNKLAAVKQFRSEPKSRVLLGQLTAAGEGLDGMQHATHRVILAEFAWTPAVNKQVIARVARGGQTKPVRASFVSLTGSVDDRVLKALVRKEKLVREILGDK